MPRPLVRLTRRATFAAAHRLYDPSFDEQTNAEIFGKCAHRGGHGHNYVVEVTVRGPVDPATGMIINLVELKHCMEEAVIQHVDHRNLNEDVSFLCGVNPTAENLAVAFWRQLEAVLPPGLLQEVRLIETANNWAAYRGETA